MVEISVNKCAKSQRAARIERTVLKYFMHTSRGYAYPTLLAHHCNCNCNLCAFTIKAGFCLFFLLFFLPLVLLKLLAPLLPLLPPLVLGLPHVTTAAVATSATGPID